MEYGWCLKKVTRYMLLNFASGTQLSRIFEFHQHSRFQTKEHKNKRFRVIRGIKKLSRNSRSKTLHEWFAVKKTSRVVCGQKNFARGSRLINF